MLEQLVGEKVLRTGLKAYLNKHKYGSTVTRLVREVTSGEHSLGTGISGMLLVVRSRVRWTWPPWWTLGPNRWASPSSPWKGTMAVQNTNHPSTAVTREWLLHNGQHWNLIFQGFFDIVCQIGAWRRINTEQELTSQGADQAIPVSAPLGES